MFYEEILSWPLNPYAFINATATFVRACSVEAVSIVFIDLSISLAAIALTSGNS